MKNSTLFGASTLGLESARANVEYALECVMESHDSDYRGGDYFRIEVGDANLVLQANFMEDDGEVTEAGFPDVEVLLYLDGESSAVEAVVAQITERLGSFSLLRSKSY